MDLAAGFDGARQASDAEITLHRCIIDGIIHLCVNSIYQPGDPSDMILRNADSRGQFSVIFTVNH